MSHPRPDRKGAPSGGCWLRRGTRYWAGALPEPLSGSRDAHARLHGQHRWGNGNRGGGGGPARVDFLREAICPETGFQPYHARKLAFGLGLSPEIVNAAGPFLQSLYRAFVETDASLLEINPCVITGDGLLVALDAKVNLDDNALYRHPELRELRDLEEETPLEVEASKFKLNYIKLDGTIACMVNGAGLAMATMDIIKLSGGTAANFLDVGGDASEERVKNAFRILLSDPNVKAVFINVFGGILRCDMLASGIVSAAKELRIKAPVVVRMEGTNVGRGQAIYAEFRPEFHRG